MTDDLQKMLDAATPGPWKARRNSSFWDVYPENRSDEDPYLIGDVCSSFPMGPDTGLQEANATLFALAPTLAARVIAAEKVVAAARELCQRVEQQQNGWPMRADYVPNALLPTQQALAAFDSLTTPSAPAPQSTQPPEAT